VQALVQNTDDDAQLGSGDPVGGGLGITFGPNWGKNPLNGEDIALLEVDGSFKTVWPPADVAIDGALTQRRRLTWPPTPAGSRR
jgi:hypothetical protein